MNLEDRIARNKQFLGDLFAGPFRGHAIITDPELPPKLGPEDYTCSEKPLEEWVSWAIREYELRCQSLEALDDDAVPFVSAMTGTQVFAAAFGCPVHIYEDSNPCAVPLLTTAEEANRLAEPGLDAPSLARVFEFAQRVRERVGPDVPIGVPDIQSPFDIAALIWRKQDLYVAIYDSPESVKRLVDKCHRLLKSFLLEYKRRFAPVNLAHCPYAWAPPDVGAWLSEDEAGAMSVATFEEFCLPSLVDLSETFGGLFVHCCAAADHQYASFRKIPSLRGLNRVFQAPGPRPAIEAFSGHTVLMVAWSEEQAIADTLNIALPDTRFLFNMPAQPLEEAKRTNERLRTLCTRA